MSEPKCKCSVIAGQTVPNPECPVHVKVVRVAPSRSPAPDRRDKIRSHPLYPKMVEAVNKHFPPGIANSGYAINAIYDFVTSVAGAAGPGEREALAELLLYIVSITGPTGGWLVSPKDVQRKIIALQARAALPQAATDQPLND